MTTTITIHRGQNIGSTIIETLKEQLLWNNINITHIDVTRDTVNKVNNAQLEYKFKR